jgi:hypothetical protein
VIINNQGRCYLLLWYNNNMSDEPTMKLYALSVAAIHQGEPPTAIGIQTVIAALPDGVSVQEAGLQVARDIFPEADAWGEHHVNAVEITQGFPLEPHRLIWRLEKGE